MKRFLRLAAVLALLVLTTGVAGAQTSGSPVTVAAVGWWTSNPTASAPTGGMAVSAGPNGTIISQGAIRFTVSAASLDRASLVLKEVEGGVQASGAAIQICPTTNTWTPVERGELAAAPPPECGRGAAPLARSASGDWTADVSLLLRGSGSVSLAVVPAGSGAVPLGFEVRFAPPRIDATATPATTTTTTTTTTTPPTSSSEVASPPPSSSGSFSFSPPPTSPLPSFGGTNTFVDGDGATVATPPPEPTGVPAVDENAAGPAPIRRVATPVSAKGGPRTVQALFFIVVSTVIGVGVGFGHARFRPAGATA